MARKLLAVLIMGAILISSLSWAYGKRHGWRKERGSRTCIMQQNGTEGGGYYKRFRKRRMNNATGM